MMWIVLFLFVIRCTVKDMGVGPSIGLCLSVADRCMELCFLLFIFCYIVYINCHPFMHLMRR